MTEVIERLNYYQLQFLGAEDFKAEQIYHRDMRRRHNLGQHTWGIVEGLELVEQPRGDGGLDVYVQPGLAIDGFGREIVVGAQYKLDSSNFQFIKGTTSSTASPHTVHIAYGEEQAGPAAFGYGACDGDSQNNRLRELFRIVVDATPKVHSPVVVDGHNLPDTALPEDGSVSYQELPDSAATRWLVPLGSVSWNANTAVQAFEHSNDLDKDRHYAGIVAAEVLSPAGKLLLRPRSITDPPPAIEPEFAEVQGQLQVDGTLIAMKDVRVEGGHMSLEIPGGNSVNTQQLWIGRFEDPASPWQDLRVHIGDGPIKRPAGPNQRLSVEHAGDIILAVQSDNIVTIDTGTLSFGPDPTANRQMINLSESGMFGIGVNAGTQYSRSPSDFVWYRGGNASGGGIDAMHLDGTGKLTVAGEIQAKSLRVIGDTTVGGNVNVDGRLRLLVNGGTGSDELALTRYQHLDPNSVAIPNAYDLRVIIGDDIDGVDAFTVGPIYWQDSKYKEAFKVTNIGDVTAAGSLSVIDGFGGLMKFNVDHAGNVVAKGGLTVAGNTQLQTLEVSGQVNAGGGDLNVGGGIVLTSPHAITYGGVKYPFDVVAGVFPTPFAAGAYPAGPFTVLTTLPQVTKASIHVALAATKGSANGEWSVAVIANTVQLQPNGVQFKLDLKIAPGCSIDAVSYIVIFIP